MDAMMHNSEISPETAFVIEFCYVMQLFFRIIMPYDMVQNSRIYFYLYLYFFHVVTMIVLPKLLPRLLNPCEK